MKKNIVITLIVLIAASLLFTGCDEMEVSKSGPDLTGTYIYSVQYEADGTVPAYSRYYYKLEINGDYYKLYSSAIAEYQQAITRWEIDCESTHTDPDDQWTCPLPLWIDKEQGYVYNTRKSHYLKSDYSSGTEFSFSQNREEIYIHDKTFVKQDPATLKAWATPIDGVWIYGDEYAAEGDYPAYVAPRMQLVIDSKHFDLFTKRAADGKTVDETIADRIAEWKDENESSLSLLDLHWWNNMATACGPFTQSGSVVTLTSTHYDQSNAMLSWSSLDATIMSDGTLKVRVPTETSYADLTFKRAETLPPVFDANHW